MKIHNFTVCDMVRVEDNGKFLLIGVYSNGVIFPQLPTQFTMTIWMLVEGEKTGKSRFSFRATMPETDAKVFEASGELDVGDVTQWVPMGLTVPVLIGQAGTIVIEVKINDGDWEPLRTLAVTKGSPVPPSPNSIN